MRQMQQTQQLKAIQDGVIFHNVGDVIVTHIAQVAILPPSLAGSA